LLISQIHIVHISTAKSWRGGERQLVYLYEELDKKGVNQTIVCAKESVLEAYCKDTKKKYISLSKRTSFDIFFAYQLKKISNRLEGTHKVIHTHDSHAHTFAVLSSILFKNNLPIVVSRRVDFKVGDNFLSLFKYNYSGVKKIICVSDAVKEITSKSIKDQNTLITIYDGIYFRGIKGKNKLRQEFNISPDHYLIGNVAALAIHKDYYTFIDVAFIAIQKGIKATFFIIGEGSEKEKIRAYIVVKKMSEHILMTGFRNDIDEISPELDVFLITSETEGLGSSILNAMECGVAVVATEAGGIPEIVKHEETGLLAPVKQPQLIAEQLLRVLSNKELKDRLIANASKKLSNFYASTMASLTANVYEEVLRESSSPSEANNNKH
jgi:glycosyltransferase involved in cell wall biosynthesis